MLSLGFGLAAALAWAVHDLQVRKLSQDGAILPMMMVVLAAGAVALAIPAAFNDGWASMSQTSYALALASGLSYVMGTGGLYQALSRAPVKVVAPILGAYPMLSLAIAAAQGDTVTIMEWLAVLLIVAGIAWVALTGREGETNMRGSLGVALGWAFLGTVGFAAMFAFGHEAVRQGSEIPVIFVTRLTALAGVLVLCLRFRSIRPAPGTVPVLIGMGILDAAALGLVTASAQLPNPEYASVAAALFGVLTILLAWRFLGEKVAALQWAGIAAVFGGVAILSLQT